VIFLTFLLRKAENKKDKEYTEGRETGAAEGKSRETYRRYQTLFSDFDFAKRSLPALTELSESIVISEDDSPTGFEFENITAYNRVIGKRKSATIYNTLALSLSDSLNLLGNYEFTRKNKNGDVVLPAQVPPAPKKTRQELGEEELTIDESFDVFSEEEQSAPTATKRTVKDKERKIPMNPEINLTELFENYKELASKTYDEFQDKDGETLTFEKVFLYLHYNRHKSLPENAKNIKTRREGIERAKKLTRRKKEEARKNKKETFTSGFEGSLGIGNIPLEEAFTSSGKRKTIGDGKIERAYQRLNAKRASIEGQIKQIEIVIKEQDKLLVELENKAGNISLLANESFRQQLPDIKTLLDKKGLEAARKERKRIKDFQTKVSQGDVDLDNPTSKEERVLAKSRKKILDLLDEEKEKQKEVRETIRDASRFFPEIDQAMTIIDSAKFYKIYGIEELESQISREEDKEKPDLNLIKELEKRIKNRKNNNNEMKEFKQDMQFLISLTDNSFDKLRTLGPKLRQLRKDKEQYSSAIDALIDFTVLSSFSRLGREYSEKAKKKDENQLQSLLENDKQMSPLLSDEEAIKLIKEVDKFVRSAFKIEEMNDSLESRMESLEKMKDEEEAY